MQRSPDRDDSASSRRDAMMQLAGIRDTTRSSHRAFAAKRHRKTFSTDTP
jgi:hypothetical protein